MTTAIIILILLGIEAIVIKVDARMLCYLAAIALLLFGFSYYAITSYIGILCIVAGVYNFTRGAIAYR